MEVQRLHEKGLSQSGIARILKVHPTTIGYHMRALGLEMPSEARRRESIRRDEEHYQRKKAKSDRNAEFARLYIDERLSCRKIAKQVGISYNVVYRALERQPHVVMRKAGRDPLPGLIKKMQKIEANPNVNPESREAVRRLMELATGRKAPSPYAPNPCL
jgi:transposase